VIILPEIHSYKTCVGITRYLQSFALEV
jgi:hypothetical protein